jgi:hypothetical protein
MATLPAGGSGIMITRMLKPRWSGLLETIFTRSPFLVNHRLTGEKKPGCLPVRQPGCPPSGCSLRDDSVWRRTRGFPSPDCSGFGFC